jgi:hypothetical protein
MEYDDCECGCYDWRCRADRQDFRRDYVVRVDSRNSVCHGGVFFLLIIRLWFHDVDCVCVGPIGVLARATSALGRGEQQAF